jgi:hypothetical protein
MRSSDGRSGKNDQNILLYGGFQVSTDNHRDISKHLLPTSSNLLGICFIILNFIKIWKAGRVETVVVDKLVGISMVLFLVASVLSYVSMRSSKNADSYEKVADIIFLSGLAFLTVIAAVRF